MTGPSRDAMGVNSQGWEGMEFWARDRKLRKMSENRQLDGKGRSPLLSEGAVPTSRPRYITNIWGQQRSSGLQVAGKDLQSEKLP